MDEHWMIYIVGSDWCPRGLRITKKTLTPATWITRQPYTAFWCLRVIFAYPPWCQSLVCSPLLSFCQLVSFSVPLTLHTARRLGVVFWSPRGSGGSGGPGDAASRSPRVKGENSENRAFWSAREDLPAPFCMLEFGRGAEGVGLGTCENREGKEKKKKDQCKWGQMTDIHC